MNESDNIQNAKIDVLTCLICGRTGFRNLSGHINSKHSISTREYREKTGYKGPLLLPDSARKMAIIANGNRNPTNFEKTQVYIPSNELELRKQLYDRAGSKCEDCGISEEFLLSQNKRGLHLHHENYEKTIPELNDVRLLCPKCHSKLHTIDKTTKYDRVCRAVTELLEALEVDLLDDNFRETPRRMASYFIENFLSFHEIQYSLEKDSSSIFQNVYGGMVLLKDTDIVGMCPHHLLPVFYKVSIAYIPTDTAIGLSKLHRIADMLAKTPLMQETYTVNLIEYLQRLLSTKDVAIKICGSHSCMTVRGVKIPNSQVITTELRGVFMSESSVREEFYFLLK